MRLWSDSFVSGDRMPERFAAARLQAGGDVQFSDNLNPHLAWAALPVGTRSLVLIAHDFDAPARAALAQPEDGEVPVEADRNDFFHWVLVDLPPEPAAIAEGEFARGFVPGGKPGPEAPRGARQGVNDYTGWFADDALLAGAYFGYDGPYPPPHDALVHHYLFTLYALRCERLPLAGRFDGRDVLRAMSGQVLGEATLSTVYTLNARLR